MEPMLSSLRSVKTMGAAGVPMALIFESRAMIRVPGSLAPGADCGSPRTTVPGWIVSVDPLVT